MVVSEYGPAVIDHVLLKVGFPPNVKLGKGFDIAQVDKICEALEEAECLLNLGLSKPSKVRSSRQRIIYCCL